MKGPGKKAQSSEFKAQSGGTKVAWTRFMGSVHGRSLVHNALEPQSSDLRDASKSTSRNKSKNWFMGSSRFH
jgi:hypothetical protein